jgi:hypothetical protein
MGIDSGGCIDASALVADTSRFAAVHMNHSRWVAMQGCMHSVVVHLRIKRCAPAGQCAHYGMAAAALVVRAQS